MEKRNAGTGMPFILFFAICLAMAASVTSKPARALDCYAIWPEEVRDDWGTWTTADGGTTTEVPCERYEPGSTALSAEFGVAINIYLPEGWMAHPHPDAPANLPQLITSASQKAIAELKPLFAPFDINIALLQNVREQSSGTAPSDSTDSAWDWDSSAETGWVSPCPVTLFVTSVVDTDPASIQATVAHELYHCYQFKYFRDQMYSGSETSVYGWWMEGTAEFFSSQLYPCNATSLGFAREFKPRLRLNRQEDPYSVFVFYTYLADSYGFDLSALAEFTRGMPITDGYTRQDAALQAYEGIGEKFHRFGKAYVDSRISHCVAGSTGFGDVARFVAENGLEVPLNVNPFSFKPPIVTLEKGKAYRVRLVDETGSGDKRRTSYRKAGEHDESAWNPLPSDFTLTGGCEEDQEWVFLSTVEADGNVARNAKLTFEELDDTTAEAVTCRRCDRAGWYRKVELDSCLVGQWMWESGGKWDYYRDTFSNIEQRKPSIVSYSAQSGARGNRLIILADGTYEYGGGEVWLEGSGLEKSNGVEKNFGHRLDAEVLPGLGAWRIDRGKLRICDIHMPGEGDFKYKGYYGDSAPRSGANEARAHQTQHIVKGKYDYSCSTSELKIVKSGPPIPGLPTMEWVYRRLSGGDGQGTPAGGGGG